jgi:hypothetical protein
MKRGELGIAWPLIERTMEPSAGLFQWEKAAAHATPGTDLKLARRTDLAPLRRTLAIEQRSRSGQT